MRDLITWTCAGAIVTATAGLALQAPEGKRSVSVVEASVTIGDDVVVIPYAATEPVPTVADDEDPRAWCEPVVPPMCSTDADCEPRPDGARRSCVPERWVEGSTAKVCIATAPPRAMQRWRAARLRVLVEAICERRNGCDPEALLAYLLTLARRESSMRPYAVHRLGEDREASYKSWRRNAHRYVDSPAHDEPWRWQSYGYFGQNSAYALAEWDATDVPERLCGEVESVLVHLRVARARLRRLEQGVTCNGKAHRGTADDGSGEDAPSWYDISLANSGSDPCPGTSGHRLRVRRSFERGAESRGLDPYGRVTSSMLGREVSRAEQVAFARRVRAAMDKVQ